MAIVDAEPKKGDIDVTSTGSSSRSKDMKKLFVPIKYSSLEDFSFSVSNIWDDRNICIFIDCCHANIDGLKNCYGSEENKVWDNITKAGLERSGSVNCFNANYCVELAKCLKSFVSKNQEKMMENEIFKLLYENVVDLLPYFAPVSTSRPKSKSKSVENNKIDEIEENPAQPDSVQSEIEVSQSIPAEKVPKKRGRKPKSASTAASTVKAIIPRTLPPRQSARIRRNKTTGNNPTSSEVTTASLSKELVPVRKLTNTCRKEEILAPKDLGFTGSHPLRLHPRKRKQNPVSMRGRSYEESEDSEIEDVPLENFNLIVQGGKVEKVKPKENVKVIMLDEIPAERLHSRKRKQNRVTMRKRSYEESEDSKIEDVPLENMNIIVQGGKAEKVKPKENVKVIMLDEIPAERLHSRKRKQNRVTMRKRSYEESEDSEIEDVPLENFNLIVQGGKVVKVKPRENVKVIMLDEIPAERLHSRKRKQNRVTMRKRSYEESEDSEIEDVPLENMNIIVHGGKVEKIKPKGNMNPVVLLDRMAVDRYLNVNTEQPRAKAPKTRVDRRRPGRPKANKAGKPAKNSTTKYRFISERRPDSPSVEVSSSSTAIARNNMTPRQVGRRELAPLRTASSISSTFFSNQSSFSAWYDSWWRKKHQEKMQKLNILARVQNELTEYEAQKKSVMDMILARLADRNRRPPE